MVSRADKAEAAGRDVSTVRTAVSGAEAAIASARDTTVAAQAAKTYAIEVTTEETLRAAVEAAREALRADLTTVRESVKETHTALRVAATTLAQIPRVNDLEVEAEAETEASATVN